MVQVTRRGLLGGAALGSIGLAACQTAPRAAEGYAGEVGFLHGVASGDPLPGAMILWTRVTPLSGTGPVTVAWEIFEAGNETPAASGEMVTSEARDYTVKADATGLVAALSHPTMLVRKHAQRLLVERGQADVAEELIQRVGDQNVDEVGLNVAAIHALWTLHGLGLIGTDHPQVAQAVVAALAHPSAGVRRNAAQVLADSSNSVDALLDANLLADRDPQVRLAALLALSDLPPGPDGAAALAADLP